MLCVPGTSHSLVEGWKSESAHLSSSVAWGIPIQVKCGPRAGTVLMLVDDPVDYEREWEA